jgi:predicted enzyme related to lactoylglutathione lyase
VQTIPTSECGCRNRTRVPISGNPSATGGHRSRRRDPEPPAAFHASKNRLHLDLAATDWDAEISRLAGLGATPIRDIEENGNRWVTFADPEGNEFDLIRR